jgi:hypothetical protein
MFGPLANHRGASTASLPDGPSPRRVAACVRAVRTQRLGLLRPRLRKSPLLVGAQEHGTTRLTAYRGTRARSPGLSHRIRPARRIRSIASIRYCLGVSPTTTTGVSCSPTSR